MEPHVQKIFDDFDTKIADHQREILKLQQAANTLCTVYGLEPRFQVSSSDGSATPSVASNSIKPDSFFGKPLATAARMALTALRANGKAPATPADIYDVLAQGGFEFPTKVREHALTGLGVSLAKNTDVFVKLPSGLIGLREWYGNSTTRRRKETNGAGADRADDGQQTQTDDASGQGENDEQGAAK